MNCSSTYSTKLASENPIARCYYQIGILHYDHQTKILKPIIPHSRQHQPYILFSQLSLSLSLLWCIVIEVKINKINICIKKKKVARMSNKCKSEGKLGRKKKKKLWFEIPISGIGFFELQNLHSQTWRKTLLELLSILLYNKKPPLSHKR